MKKQPYWLTSRWYLCSIAFIILLVCVRALRAAEKLLHWLGRLVSVFEHIIVTMFDIAGTCVDYLCDKCVDIETWAIALDARALVEPSPDYKGSAFYPDHFQNYDRFVYDINSRFAWGPTARDIKAMYLRLFTPSGKPKALHQCLLLPIESDVGSSYRHVEVGLASPSFLLEALPHRSSVLLVDVDSDWLTRGTACLLESGYSSVSSLSHDVRRAFPRPQEDKDGIVQTWEGTADSVALNFVLHCTEGSLGPRSKGASFQNLKRLLKPNGVLFGSTILNSPHNCFGRALMRRFNEPMSPDVPMSGIFSNTGDRLSDLREALGTAFEATQVRVVGATAFFAASNDSKRNLTDLLGM